MLATEEYVSNLEPAYAYVMLKSKLSKALLQWSFVYSNSCSKFEAQGRVVKVILLNCIALSSPHYF